MKYKRQNLGLDVSACSSLNMLEPLWIQPVFVPTPIKVEKSQRANAFIYQERGRDLNTFCAECLSKNSVHQLCPCAFSPGWLLLARSFTRSLEEKNAARAREDKRGEEMKNTDWWTEGLKFLSEQDGKRVDDTEEGSGEQGYTFLWVQNTLSFNKGTYLPLCVI